MILIAVADPGFPIGRGADLLGVLTSDAGAFFCPLDPPMYWVYSTNVVHNLMVLSITEIRRECYAAQTIQSTDSPQVSYPNGQATPSEKRKRCRFIGFLLFPIYLPHQVKVKAMSLFNWVL